MGSPNNKFDDSKPKQAAEDGSCKNESPIDITKKFKKHLDSNGLITDRLKRDKSSTKMNTSTSQLRIHD